MKTVLVLTALFCSFLRTSFSFGFFNSDKNNDVLKFPNWQVERQSFPAYKNLDVIVVRNFLQEEDMELVSRSLSNISSSEWLYATNTGENGAKVRSNENIARRRLQVEESNERRQFSYSKSELPVTHFLIHELKSIFRRKEVMNALSSLFQSNRVSAKYITELFVAKYSADDFLSWHGDAASGSFAFILILVGDNWDSSVDGGALQFLCHNNGRQATEDVCLDLSPSFNTLVMFRTRYTASGHAREFPLLHRVDRVRAVDKDRITVTGWYMCKGDKMTKAEWQMCAEMKGSSCEEDDEDL